MRKEITEILCDRCGCEMDDPHTIEIRIPKSVPMTIERLASRWEHVDLCPDCCKSFAKWWGIKNA